MPVPPQCLTPSSSPGVPLVRRIAFNSQTGVEMGPYKLMENYGRWPLLEGSRSPVAFVSRLDEDDRPFAAASVVVMSRPGRPRHVSDVLHVRYSTRVVGSPVPKPSGPCRRLRTYVRHTLNRLPRACNVTELTVHSTPNTSLSQTAVLTYYRNSRRGYRYRGVA